MSELVPYHDNHILIGQKPRGIPTQDGFTEVVRDWVKNRFQKPGNVFLQPIHRLDRPVGGLVLFARTSKALSRLQKMQKERAIEKIYLAQLEGLLLPKRGTLLHYLKHGDHIAHVSLVEKEGFKKALLNYEVLKCEEETSLVRIHLRTGRYHQIRAQFGALGFPVVGDQKYGSSIRREGLELTASELSLIHPVSKKPIHIKVSLYKTPIGIRDQETKVSKAPFC